MKKLLLSLLFSATLFATTNSCMLDVYFGNGVWNTKKDAKKSAKKLMKFMQDHNPERFFLAENNTTYSFKLAYNHKYGTLTDLIETYWQLYESGQISEGYFTFVARTLDGSRTEASFLENLKEIIVQSDGDMNTMYANYQSESFSQNHNVLLVSHSQGNLFANKIYAILEDQEKQHFRNVAIATPADRVFSGGKYITLDSDPIIGAIPDSLPGNASGFGHAFVDAYINNDDSAAKMSIAFNEAVELLDSIGCGKYTGYQFVSYICNGSSSTASNFDVDIYGAYYEGSLAYTEVVTQEHQSSGGYDTDGNCLLQDFDIQTVAPQYDNGGCEAYIMKSFSTEVKHMGFSNVLTCAQYSISSETANKLNGMLTATP